MKNKYLAAACAASMVLALPTLTEAAPRVADAGAVMTVSGQASKLLTNDEAVLTFSAQAQNERAQSATDEIVRAGNAALEALKPFGDKVDVKTADFSTWPVMTRAKEGEASEIASWGAKQTIRVTVHDLSVVSSVMSAAGKTMNYDGVTFSVSRAVREAAQNELLAEAVKSAGDRAVIAAQALGLGEKNVRIEGMQISGLAGPSPRYYAQPVMLKSAAVNDAAPSVSAGSADASLTVTLTVRIAP